MIDVVIRRHAGDYPQGLFPTPRAHHLPQGHPRRINLPYLTQTPRTPQGRYRRSEIAVRQGPALPIHGKTQPEPFH